MVQFINMTKTKTDRKGWIVIVLKDVIKTHTFGLAYNVY